MTPHRFYPSRHGPTGGSSGRRGRTSVSWFKARRPTASRSPIIVVGKCPAGIEPASPAWKAGASADRPRARRRKVKESNSQGSSLGRFRPRLPSPVGLTFHNEAPVAGLEPAVGQTPRRLNRPIPAINSGTPDHKVRTAGFEPALSCARSTRNTRLSYVLPIKSAQRELNPRFRLGKAAGCRYIMGAISCGLDCQRAKSTGPTLRVGARTRTRVAALRVRYPRRRTTSAVSQWDQRDLNPHLAD